MHHNKAEFLGVDVGQAWVGVARGSIQARLAEPLISLPANQALDKLKSFAENQAVGGIVVGLPRGLNGQETTQTQAVRQWVKTAKSAIDLPFYGQDEALTSVLAAKLQTAKAKTDEHAQAAAIILQDFLDTPVKNRVSL